MDASELSKLTRREVLQFAGRNAVILGGAPIIAALAGCGGSGAPGSGTVNGQSVSNQWVTAMLSAISAVKPGPPMTARAIGIVTTAMYDAWACYDRVALGTRLGAKLRRPVTEHSVGNQNQAISFAAYRALVDLYPTEQPRFDAQMKLFGYNPADASTAPTTPTGVGNTVAAALIQFRHNDGSNQLNNYADTTGYVPINTPSSVVDPSKWQQLKFANGKSPAYIAPQWGNVIPFAMSSSSEFRPPAPPVYGTPAYIQQAQEVVDLTANLNDTTKVIAEYWADGPASVLPPGHWQLFGLYVSARDRHTLAQDVQMFFMLGNAVFDSSIACWDCKRVFNTSRPITAIRALFAGQQIASFAGPNMGIQIVDGSQWFPYQSVNFITPPFPEYSSGHSTFSAASAEILKRFTGSDLFGNSVTIQAGTSGFESGVPSSAVTLSWPTFTDAANQAGLSRLYGGIHFRAANVEAQACGRLVGAAVWDRCSGYIYGSSSAPLP